MLRSIFTPSPHKRAHLLYTSARHNNIQFRLCVRRNIGRSVGGPAGRTRSTRSVGRRRKEKKKKTPRTYAARVAVELRRVRRRRQAPRERRKTTQVAEEKKYYEKKKKIPNVHDIVKVCVVSHRSFVNISRKTFRSSSARDRFIPPQEFAPSPPVAMLKKKPFV